MTEFLEDVERAAREEEYKTTTVPEWKDQHGQPREIFAREPTVHELGLVEKHQAEHDGSIVHRMAMLAALTFRDSNGKRLIPTGKVPKFAQTVKSTVLTRVLTELDLFNIDDVDAIDLEAEAGKSEPTVVAA
ncbi:MAG: hypothetical protein AAGE01_10325 [Pseudomonadota bacterium]